MKKNQTIRFDTETREALDRLVGKRGTTMSEVVRNLITAEERKMQTEGELKAILATARSAERNTQILIGLLNSIAFGFPTLATAEYMDPDNKKHEILRGAVRKANMIARKRILHMKQLKRSIDR